MFPRFLAQPSGIGISRETVQEDYVNNSVGWNIGLVYNMYRIIVTLFNRVDPREEFFVRLGLRSILV